MILHHKIFGWFSTKGEQVCAEMVMKYPDGSLFVEVGTFMGKSACYIAQEIKRKNKKIEFHVIDNFKDNENKQKLAGRDLFEIWCENMKKAEVFDSINVFKLNSLDAVENYKDKSIDFLYLDADHSYEAVKSDIQKWLPKIKIGGTFAGDDFCKKDVEKAVTEILGKVRVHGVTWIYEVK